MFPDDTPTEGSPLMGRPRSFEESELLEAVMIAFWRHGYSATTYRSLEALCGVGIKTLSTTFGEKDELFTKALARYRRRATDTLATVFDPPSVDAIIRVFERLSSPVDGDDVCNAGCLMVNTVFELDEPAETIANEIAQFRELWRSTFQRALETDRIADPETKAEYLVGSLWGALSQIRLAGDTTAAQPMTSVIIDTIRTWTNPTTP
jgi:TetR/AcrR family transcriptional regulator, transcriptional repressor for nem operon